jgi:hypothetical protein
MRRIIPAVILLCLAAGGIWWWTLPSSIDQPNAPSISSPQTSARPSLTNQPQKIFASNSASAPRETTSDEDSPILQRPTIPADPEAQQRVDQMTYLLRDYRLTLSQNPTGSNAEITAALLGNNLKQVRFEIPAGSSVRNEELCDFWGTAYFFHQISSAQMEIRSAGPDRTLWTEDDILAR